MIHPWSTAAIRRAGALAGVMVAVVAVAACSGPAAPQAAAPSSPTAAPPASQAASSASPTAAPVTAVATSGSVFTTPLDAVPSADGSTIWFTASGAEGPGVFVSADGGTRPLVTGAPMRGPAGLALTADERGLLVADPEADAVYAVPAAGGAATELPGTRGLHPRGVEVAGDRLYVTGIDATSGSGAVFALPVTGGKATAVAKGLAMPDGITVAADGALLVTDRPGSVLRLAGGAVHTLATGVRLGSPAGLTLTADGAALLVSSLDPTAGTAQVLALDPTTGRRLGVFDDVIGANHAAGGLHRAHTGTVAAWADVSRSGSVYRVQTSKVSLS